MFFGLHSWGLNVCLRSTKLISHDILSHRLFCFSKMSGCIGKVLREFWMILTQKRLRLIWCDARRRKHQWLKWLRGAMMSDVISCPSLALLITSNCNSWPVSKRRRRFGSKKVLNSCDSNTTWSDWAPLSQLYFSSLLPGGVPLWNFWYAKDAVFFDCANEVFEVDGGHVKIKKHLCSDLEIRWLENPWCHTALAYP